MTPAMDGEPCPGPPSECQAARRLITGRLREADSQGRCQSGADVNVVQQMLGHKSATMTLDLYGHLFGDRLDEVAAALDVAARAAGVSPVCPRRAVVDLDVKRRSATGQGLQGL
jgi:hypothetical protein